MIPVTATTIHLIVADAAKASAWYEQAFAARELTRITLDDGRLIHVEVHVGPTTFMLADEFPEHGAVAPSRDAAPSSVYYLHTRDVDALWQRALDAGARVTRPLADTSWGEREGQLADPFGYRWGLTQQLRDVSPEEMAAAARAMFATP